MWGLAGFRQCGSLWFASLLTRIHVGVPLASGGQGESPLWLPARPHPPPWCGRGSGRVGVCSCAAALLGGVVPQASCGSGEGALALLSSDGPFPPPWFGRGSGRIRFCPCAPCAVFPGGSGAWSRGVAASALAGVTGVPEARGGRGLSWGGFARPRPPPGWGRGSGWLSFCLRGTCALVSSDGGVPVGLRGSGRRASALVGSSGEPFPPPWCGRGSGRVRLCPCAPCAVFPAGGGVLGPGAASSALAEVTCVQEALGGGGSLLHGGRLHVPDPLPGGGGGRGG